jgi:alpha-amylase
MAQKYGDRSPTRLMRFSASFGFAFLLFACTAPPAPTTAPTQPAPAALQLNEDWSTDILYFVIVDRFADGDAMNNAGVNRDEKGTFHGGDFDGLTAHLDEIASLGVTSIWITPVVKNIPGFVTGAGFPDWGYHGYWADDFHALDERFGTEEDLKTLVDAAHGRGIKVLLDVVYNHAGYNSKYLTNPETKNWFRSNERGTCGSDDLTSCVAGLPDFKTEMPEVADYLMKAHLGLAKRVGLDGFRLDTVKHVDHPFWHEHRTRTRAELGNGFFLVGEVWGGDAQSLDPWFSGDEMDSGFDFGFQGSALGWLQGRGRTVAFDRYLESRDKVREGHHLAHFLSSHDVTGSLKQLEGDKELFKLAALLQMTTRGIPTIYYGEEVARAGGEWPFNRSDMPWGDRAIEPGAGDARDEVLRADYVKLISIRRAHPALAKGPHQSVSSEGDLLVFLRELPEGADSVMVAVNRGSSAAEASIALPAGWTASVRDLWNGESLSSTDGTLKLGVPARGARILVPDRP